MIDLLQQLLVPGGLLTAVFAWWATTHTKKGAEKTPVEEGHKAEVEAVLRDSGIEERWQRLFDQQSKALQKQIDDLRKELAETKRESAKARRQREDDQLTIAALYGYGHIVRSQVEELGGDPHPWPPRLDPAVWPPTAN